MFDKQKFCIQLENMVTSVSTTPRYLLEFINEQKQKSPNQAEYIDHMVQQKLNRSVKEAKIQIVHIENLQAKILKYYRTR